MEYTELCWRHTWKCLKMAKMTIFRHVANGRYGRQGSPRVAKVHWGPQGWVRCIKGGGRSETKSYIQDRLIHQCIGSLTGLLPHCNRILCGDHCHHIWTARNSAGGGHGRRQWGFEVSNPAPSTSNTTQSSTPHHLWHSNIMNTIMYIMAEYFQRPAEGPDAF